MKLPIELFLGRISPGQVYYFISDKLNSDVPHFFVCCTIIDGVVFLVCCTSQFEKRKSYIEKRNLPNSTLVWLKPNDENGFKVDTYVDCNTHYNYTLQKLAQLYGDDELEYKGQLSESDFHQILIGLNESPIIEENIKEKLPLIDDYNESDK